MREQSGWFFTLLAVPFIFTIALLAAVQPTTPAYAAAPAPYYAHHALPPWWRQPGGTFQPGARFQAAPGMARPNGPGAFGAAPNPNRSGANAPNGSNRGRFHDRPPFGRYGRPDFSNARPEPGMTFDGWRLLAALAVGGGFAGLAWSVGNRQGNPIPVGGTWANAEQEVTLLREEVDRLRSEQRQLRAAVDWQERLLSEVNRPQIPPDSLS